MMQSRTKMGALALLLIVSGCSRPPTAPQTQASAPREEERTVILQREPVAIAQQLRNQQGLVEMKMTDQGFAPSSMTVQAGAVVKIHLINAGTHTYNLVLPRYGVVTSPMVPGAENYIEFTASEAGIWPFFSDASGEVQWRGELYVQAE